MVDLLSYRAKEKNMAFIYKIVNDVNDKVYVGKTTSSIEERFKEHCKDCLRIRKEKRPLYDAMQKYGKEHFQIILLEECSVDILNDREKYWIEYYNSYEFGYNATYGGDGTVLYDYRKLADIYLEYQNLTMAAQIAQCDVDTMRKALREYHIPIVNAGQARANTTKLNQKKVQGINLKTKETTPIFNDNYEAAEWIIEQELTKSKDLRHIRRAIYKVLNYKENRTQAYGYKWVNIE